MKNITEYVFPEDLEKMSYEELGELAEQIREYLITVVSKTGGHLASNLGVVELTIALFRVFDCFRDRIIWDVGHQSYVHKILSGRADDFRSFRQLNGLSGFPKINESDADVFNTGHASNSISLASGLVTARDLNGEDYNVISVIGDGALTGGMAFEGLNNLGVMKSKAIVVVNDNGMSISRNKGGLARHLGKLRLSSSYTQAKSTVKSALDKVPVVGHPVSKGLSSIKNTVKYALVDGGAIFEALGFRYIGPIDGHDIQAMVETFQLAEQYDHPVLIHVMTTKGKGYRHAEENPDKFHGIGSFDTDTGRPLKNKDSYSDVFGRKLTSMALNDDRICAVYAAMEDGTGLGLFSEMFPERSFDTGIAEEHAVSFAAGLAKGGKRPVVAIYSTFLQRAYDQILEDVCLQDLPVIFAIDRAGVVGADGETHHGLFDLSYLSTMPNMTVLAPCDYAELEKMLDFAMTLDGPCAIRYPRGEEEENISASFPQDVEYGKAQVLFTGRDAQIVACGSMVSSAVKAAAILDRQGIKAGVTNARFVKPLDADCVRDTAVNTKLLVTLEDNVVTGGMGSYVSSLGLDIPVLSLGWPDEFIPHGSVGELRDMYGLSPEKIAERIKKALEEE